MSFMDFFLPGGRGMRVKEVARELGDKIDRKLAKARDVLSKEAQEQIERMLDEEVNEHARMLTESELDDLRKQVREHLRGKGLYQAQPTTIAAKSARSVSPAVRALLEQAKSVTTVSPAARALLSGVSRKSSKPSKLAYPPSPRGWSRRLKG